jgi:3-isopropylmalate/(R)-2-methylmalate dehydratase small subunit
MKAFTTITSSLLPLDRSNVDTDAIIPQQYLKSVKRTGFGINLFDNWRYLDPGVLGQNHGKRRINSDFVLNKPEYKDAKILLARENFGCGSSREHAVWSILDYGFEVVIASSFADIFCSNCYKNGLLPITLMEDEVDYLFEQIKMNSAFECKVDLREQKIIDENNETFKFQIDEFRKYCLLNGFDEIDLTLQHADKIRSYENKVKQTSPWLIE